MNLMNDSHLEDSHEYHENDILPQQKQQNCSRSVREVIVQVRFISNVLWGMSSFLGIPANVFVLFSIIYFKDMRTISNIYIFNLALADLLFLGGTPIMIIQSVTREWIFGSTTCKLFISFNGVSQFASAVFIAVLSFDRYLAVCRPIRSAHWRTIHAAIILSLASWAMVVLEMTPLLLFVKLIKLSGGLTDAKQSCMLFAGDEKIFDLTIPEGLSPSEGEVYLFNQLEIMEHRTMMSRRFFTTYLFTLSYLLPLIAVWLFYSKIIGKMWFRRKQTQIKAEITKKRTTKVTIMGLAIVTSYTLCWLPFWIVQWSIEMNIGWNRNHQLLTLASYGAYALQYMNSAANPFLYVFFSDSFKRNLSKLVASRSPSNKLRIDFEEREVARMISHKRSTESSF